MNTERITIEDKIKEMILLKYKSLQSFSNETGIKYQTLVSILNRGIHNASVSNVIKICQALEISTDELAKDRIIPAINKREYMEFREMYDVLNYAKMNIQTYKGCTINGYPMDEEDARLIIDSLELTLEFIRRKKVRERNK